MCVHARTLVGSIATLVVRGGRQDAGLKPIWDPKQIFGVSIEYEKQTAGRGAFSVVDKKVEGEGGGWAGGGMEK